MRLATTLPALILFASATCAQAADAPPLIDVSKAPAPLFDDPVWHGASDPAVVWMPAQHEYWMYYTQRRATLEHPNGVDWVHGSAIGIAASPDGLHWTYKSICTGDKNLGKPVENNTTWWAPFVMWQAGKLHMFVTQVHGIFTKWTGDRTIEHFSSDDGLTWKFESTAQLSSLRCIDPTLFKIGNDWWLWYKDESKGSHTWAATSTDLNTWTVKGEMVGGEGHEAPFVWKWKDAYWLICDAHGKGLKIYKSPDGTGNWEFNNRILAAKDGRRPDDNSQGFHPWVLMQGTPGNEQLVLFYFTQFGRRTVMQMAELSLDADGKLTCDRNKYAPPATMPATAPK